MSLLLVPLFFLIAVVVGLAVCVLWIWMLIDAIQNKGLSDGEKVAWVLAIIFLHFIGAVLYFIIGRPKRNAPLPAG